MTTSPAARATVSDGGRPASPVAGRDTPGPLAIGNHSKLKTKRQSSTLLLRIDREFDVREKNKGLKAPCLKFQLS
jgi:hypothetical protein